MITSNRDVYFSGHTTPDVKEAIIKEAKKQQKSMSQLMHEILRDQMKKLGHRDILGHSFRVTS